MGKLRVLKKESKNNKDIESLKKWVSCSAVQPRSTCVGSPQPVEI